MAAKRASLGGNVKRPDTAQAVEVARKLTGQDEGPAEYQGETETVSYNLPVDLIELYRDLAEERLKLDREEKRAARRAGHKPPQARRSASAVVREAMEAHRHAVEAELARLQGR